MHNFQVLAYFEENSHIYPICRCLGIDAKLYQIHEKGNTKEKEVRRIWDIEVDKGIQCYSSKEAPLKNERFG